MQVLEEHNLRQCRPVHHLGRVDNQRAQHAGEDEAAEGNGKRRKDGGAGGNGLVVKQPLDGVDFDARQAIVARRCNEGRDDVLLDSKCLTRVDEAQGTADGLVAEAIGVWRAVCPGFAKEEDKYWIGKVSKQLRSECVGRSIRCRKTAETCICVGLKT